MAELIKFEVPTIVEDLKNYRNREGETKGISSNCHIEFSSRYGEVVAVIVIDGISCCSITITTDDYLQIDCGGRISESLTISENLEQYLIKYCFNAVEVCEAINKFHLLEYFG